MVLLDYIVVAVFLVGLLALGFFLSRKAGSSTDEYILAGRKMPFWLAGTSVVATGLNASDMLQNSRKVRQDGLTGMWFNWRSILNTTIDMIWFLRLWRRAKFTTQMEFYHARYDGWQATFARLYDSLIYGMFLSAVWASLGVVGMKKIASVLLGLDPTIMIAGMSVSTDVVVVCGIIIVTMVYSIASGVYGVVWTDLVEFIVTMVCAYMLMFRIYPEVGWNTGLHERLVNLGEAGGKYFTLMPGFGLVIVWFLILEPILSRGGYSPHVQRYLCVKNEREVLYTGIYSNIINVTFKGWPFIVCGLAGMFIISDQYLLDNFAGIVTPAGDTVPDYEKVLPILVSRYLPVGLVGLMIAGFMSAFMSSFDTNIHNSTCIFENDIYRAYIRKDASEKHYVRVSRIFMGLVACLAALIGLLVNDILYLMMAGMAIMGSAGWIKLLRFLWWRVNGAAEVAAQLSALIFAPLFLSPFGTKIVVAVMDAVGVEGNDGFYVYRQIIMMGLPTIVALIAMFVFPAEPEEKLVAFYRRVRPYGWWTPVKEAAGMAGQKEDSLWLLTWLTVACSAALFGSTFVALGLFLAMWNVLVWGALAMIAGTVFTIIGIRRLYPDSEEESVA